MHRKSALLKLSFLVVLLMMAVLVYGQGKIKGDIQNKCSLEEKIGQMIIVGFMGPDLSKENAALKEQIALGNVAGVLLMSGNYNIVNRAQVTSLVNEIKGVKTKYPLFIAIDQEGGKIGRLNRDNGFEDFPSNKEMARTKFPEEAFLIYLRMAKMLKNLGINFNLAPVVDLDLGSSFIKNKERSFSADPQVVVKFAEQFIVAHHQAGVLIALKHFPGVGSAKNDPHEEMVDLTDTYDEKELIPYYALMKKSMVDAVMVSHAMNSKVDSREMASLSLAYIKNKLKEEMGFKGVVISDSLSMSAVTKRYSFEEAVIRAVNSGNDILFFSGCFYQNTNIPEKVIQIIIKAIKDGKIEVERIEESFRKVYKLKQSLRKAAANY